MIATMIASSVVEAGASVPVRPAEALTRVLVEKAEFWNTSFSVGIWTANGAWTATGGMNDRKRGTPVMPYHRFPLGSVTKPYTCAAVMQAFEKGLIDLDAPISKYVDPILQHQNGTTMLELWNNDTNVSKVTARRLMGMRAGFHEYNDSWYHDVTLNEPHHEVSPFEILHRMNKNWASEPGTHWGYASTGYELLGLALTHVHGLETWEEYNQMDVIPSILRDGYNGTRYLFGEKLQARVAVNLPDSTHLFPYIRVWLSVFLAKARAATIRSLYTSMPTHPVRYSRLLQKCQSTKKKQIFAVVKCAAVLKIST